MVAGSCFCGWSLALLAGCTDDTKPSKGQPAAGANSAGASNASAGAGATPTSGGASSGGPSAAGSESGGAPVSAGTGGAATGAGGSSLGGSAGNADACAGTLICDDFESYTSKPGAPWTVSTNNGTVAIDTTKYRSGKQSVKFSTTGANNYQRAFIGLQGAPFPVANNAFYGRMMIYATAAANDGVHWTMIQAEGPVAAQGITTATVRYGGQQMKSLMANYDSTGKKSDCWQHSSTKMPEGTWACMQWYFDGKTNTQKFWLNGSAIADLTVMGDGQGCIDHETNDTWYFPQDFTKAYVGWESYQKDDPREVWIDDVALSTQPIACPGGT
jgi:polysaccharide lyase-like protein